MSSIPIVELQSPAQPSHTLHLAHANGFPPQCYRVLVNALPREYRVVSLGARPLWTPPPPPHELQDWGLMADDLRQGLKEHGLNQVIGVGHSMGGTATILASLREPQRFKAMILLDPTLLPKRLLMLLGFMSRLPMFKLGMARTALTRKRTWESEESAFQRYRTRGLFTHWSDEAIRDYVHSISRAVRDAEGNVTHLELTYSPEWEAQIYETIPTDIWDAVPKISVPTLVIYGENTNTFTTRSAKYWRKLRPDIEVIGIPNTTHFVPLEAPEIVAGHIQKFIAGLGKA